MSSYMAVWYSRVGSGVQGRVLAADALIGIGVEVLGSAIAGVLADYVLEPTIQANRWIELTMGDLVGSGMGSGIALLMMINALGMMILGITGLKFWGGEERSQTPQQ